MEKTGANSFMTIEFRLRQSTDQTPSADHTDGKLDDCAMCERDAERTSVGSSLLPRQSWTETASGVNMFQTGGTLFS